MTWLWFTQPSKHLFFCNCLTRGKCLSSHIGFLAAITSVTTREIATPHWYPVLISIFSYTSLAVSVHWRYWLKPKLCLHRRLFSRDTSINVLLVTCRMFHPGGKGCVCVKRCVRVCMPKWKGQHSKSAWVQFSRFCLMWLVAVVVTNITLPLTVPWIPPTPTPSSHPQPFPALAHFLVSFTELIE